MRRIIIIGMLVLMGGLAGWFINQLTQYNSVALKGPSNTPVKIYGAAKNADGDSTYNPDDLVAEITGQAEKWMKDGDYFAVIAENPDYSETIYKFKVSESGMIPLRFKYSDERLKSLTKLEASSVQSEMKKKFPRLEGNYNFGSGKLFAEGDWYGGTIVAKNGQADTLRFIAHKVNGQWKVLTDPPLILIGGPSNPDIPYEVVKGANNL